MLLYCCSSTTSLFSMASKTKYFDKVLLFSPVSKFVSLALAFLIFHIKLTSGLQIEKELGTNKGIDVSEDPNYRVLPSLEQCGFITDRPKRIVGGRPYSYKKFPWMAQLYFTNITTGNSSLNCGGTFITRSVVLTAAHCVSRIATGMSMIHVGFGHSDRSKIKLCKPWDKDTREKCSKKFSRMVRRFVVHEGYQEGTLQNDIALMYLEEPVRFSSRVRPICLPYSEELLKDWMTTKLRVVGWGIQAKLDENPRVPARNLLAVDIHVRDRSYCDQFHTRQYGKLVGDRFCAGGEVASGSCSGDSGGPLLKRLPVALLGGKERFFQFGIVSSGNKGSCGYQGLPNIYTNVLYFVPWILENLAMNYAVESVESFSAELRLPSKELVSKEDAEDDENPILSTDPMRDQYKSELSTGLDIDVMAHPKLTLLPRIHECGSVQPPAPNKTSLDSEDFDDSVEIEYDDDGEEEEDEPQRLWKADAVHSRRRRMVGGRVAGFGWFPFYAQIYIRDVITGDGGFRCAGTILNDKVIVTAAQCVSELPGALALESIHVANSNRNKTEDCLGTECFKMKAYSIKEVIIHEHYTKYSHEFDIALIKIAGKLQFSRVVQPICLPLSEEFVLEELKDNVMISAGWGHLKKDSGEEQKPPNSNLLQYLEVKLKPRVFCERMYSRYVGRLTRAQICGGGVAGKGECDHDEGGGLIKPLKVTAAGGKKNNKYVLFGITSGQECGSEGMPSVYTNVMYFMPWILDHI